MVTFVVRGRASGEWTRLVEAETEEKALAKARAEMDREDWIPDLDMCDDADIWSVTKARHIGDPK